MREEGCWYYTGRGWLKCKKEASATPTWTGTGLHLAVSGEGPPLTVRATVPWPAVPLSGTGWFESPSWHRLSLLWLVVVTLSHFRKMPLAAVSFQMLPSSSFTSYCTTDAECVQCLTWIKWWTGQAACCSAVSETETEQSAVHWTQFPPPPSLVCSVFSRISALQQRVQVALRNHHNETKQIFRALCMYTGSTQGKDITLIVHCSPFMHSFSCLPHDRSRASSTASSPQSAI
jgi:hypothetical protein